MLIILWACKPRKQWPVYFTLSVHEMRSAEGRGARANDEEGLMPAPMLVGLISQDYLHKFYDDNRTDSIGSQDAVIFINPVNYTVDPTADKSAFEEDLIEEEP